MRKSFKYPYAAPELRTDDENFEYIWHDSHVVRVLAFEGRVASDHGQWDEAMTYDMDGVRLGSDIFTGPTEMCAEEGAACASTSRRHAWGLVNKISLPTARKQAQRLLEIDDNLPSAHDIMQQQEWYTQGTLRNDFRNSNWHAEFVTQPDTGSAATFDASAAVDAEKINATSESTVMHDYSIYMDAIVANQLKPYREYLATPPPKTPLDPITPRLIDTYGNLRFYRGLCIAMNELLATELTLRAYKANHGYYPPSLATLVPASMTRVPIDPFNDDKPLQYRRTNDGYILYSFGPDGDDNGGKPIDEPTAEPNMRHRVTGSGQIGDIVAGVNF